MSRYEWEAGTIVLPSSDAPMVKKEVRAAAEAHRRTLYDAAQRFWRELPRRFRADRTLYTRAVDAFVHGLAGAPGASGLPDWPGFDDDGDWNGWGADLRNLLLSVTVERVTDDTLGYRYTEFVDRSPRRVLRADIGALWPGATGPDPLFHCGESTLSFSGRTAEWRVPENNHACDHRRSHPVARAFFDALGRVRWTRGSGGEIVGNDEYNQCADYAGGGANYVIETYGPRSAR